MSMISHQIEELRGYAEAWQGMDVSRAIYGAIDTIEALSAKVREQNLGCTHCEHYDQQVTAMVCKDCRRYYQDRHTSTKAHYPLWYAQKIKQIPSAERPHGKWILTESGKWYKCSVCNEEGVENPDYYLDEPIFTDYCPNCGAKMGKP